MIGKRLIMTVIRIGSSGAQKGQAAVRTIILLQGQTLVVTGGLGVSAQKDNDKYSK